MSRRKSGGGGSLLIAIAIIFALVHYGHFNPTSFFNGLGSGGGSSSSGYYSCGQLENLWVQAGGPASAEVQMASIAMAESSGNPNATNSNTDGSTDYGLFQINSNVATPTFDPLSNAQEAVAIYNVRGYTAWVTYDKGVANGC